jgi:cyclomaltodextrinase / maltogenic alpha-amylase / neopullulanase
MQDFIFGTLSTDELKLISHCASHWGVQHDQRLKPLDPLPGEEVQISVLTGTAIQAEHIACYYTTDGGEPSGSFGKARNGSVVLLEKVGVEWDTFNWGYVTRWNGKLPAQNEASVVRYQIGAWSKGGRETFANWPDVKVTVEEAARAYFHNELSQAGFLDSPNEKSTFTYHVDTLQPPQWARQAVIYHIFVDRFNPGDGNEWRQTSNLKDFIGGTLVGITQKLDYIAELGANCIWLSPVFPSPTPHGYDATDYQRVEPRLGGDQALAELVREAHMRDIRIILDLACNHISCQHLIFQDALSNSTSKYRGWFTFDDSPIGYQTYFGVRSMPRLNLNHPEARQWMIDVARYLLREFDIDGFRLDHANGPGPSFWSDFWTACKQEKPASFCFGEIVEPPDVILGYTGRMDGALDFHLADTIRRTYAFKSSDEQAFKYFISCHQDYFRGDLLLLTFLDNHDMDRFLYIAGGDKSALRKAASIQMQLPGPPIIYYGSEVGLSQTLSKSSQVGLEVSRKAMVWGDEQDQVLLSFYKSIIHDRKEKKPWLRNLKPIEES